MRLNNNNDDDDSNNNISYRTEQVKPLCNPPSSAEVSKGQFVADGACSRKANQSD